MPIPSQPLPSNVGEKKLGKSARLLRAIIPAEWWSEADTRRRARLTVTLSLTLAAFGPTFAAVYWWLGDPILAWAELAATLGAAVPLIALKMGGSPVLAGNLGAAALGWMAIFDAARNGGITAPAVLWWPLAATLAVLLAGRRSGIVWSVVLGVAMLAMAQLGHLGLLPAPAIGPRGLEIAHLLGAVSGLAAFVWVALLHDAVKQATLHELAVTARRATLASSVKSRFLAAVSHEIRTPLTAILAYGDLLGDPESSEADRQRFVAGLQRQGSLLLTLIDNLLDLAQLEAGGVVARRVPCELHELCHDVVWALRPQAGDKGVVLWSTVESSVPGEVLSDPARLRQLLVALVASTIRLAPGRGTVSVDVHATPVAADGRFTLSIEVNGNIDAAGMPRILELFEPLEGSRAARSGGSGVDLALARQLAALLGGNLEVTSTSDGRGTLAVVLEMEAAARPRPSEARASVSGRSARVLVADDSPEIQQVMGLYLQRAGIEVEMADDGNAACERTLAAEAAGRPFDVVLVDVDMPVLSGDAAVAYLRRVGYTRPVVALTAHALEHERKRCLDAGFDDFATKPIARRALLELVGRFGDAGVAPELPRTVPFIPEHDEEFERLKESFLNRLPLRAVALERSLANGDLAQLKALAHKLKGTAAAYGEGAVADAAAALETQSGNAGALPDLTARVHEVAELCKRAAGQ